MLRNCLKTLLCVLLVLMLPLYALAVVIDWIMVF